MAKDSRGRKLKDGEYQLKDGRYRYRYTDAAGKRRDLYSWRLVPSDVTPAGKKDNKCLRELEREAQRDAMDQIVDAEIRVEDFVKKYLESKVNLAATTKTLHDSIWRTHVKGSVLGRMKISKVKKVDVIQFYTKLHTEKGFSEGTIKNVHGVLNPSFRLAVENGFLRINPCTGSLKGICGKEIESRRALSREEQTNFIAFVKSSKIYSKHYPLIATLLGTGIRISELAGLVWENVDLEKKMLTVDHQVVYIPINGSHKFLWTSTKNRTVRTIPLQENLTEILKQYKETYFANGLSSVRELNGHRDFVFLSRWKNPVINSGIERMFKCLNRQYLLEESEKALQEGREPVILPSVTPHVLRHTYCTRMAEAGVDIKVLQTLMGHKSLEMTLQVYNHVDLDRLKKSVDNAEEIEL